MIDEAQTNNPLNKPACLRNFNKTPRILFAGVLLIIAANYILQKTTLKTEPVDTWSEETLLVIRKEQKDEFWQGVRNVLELMDTNLNTSLSKISLKTGMDPLLAAEKLLPEPIEFIVLKNNNSENLTKYEFVLVTRADGQGIENLQAADNVARDFFSWYVPIRKYDILKDGSRIKSQVADPSSVQIKNGDFKGTEIKFISEPGVPFEYARMHHERWLFFSTSKLALEQLISKDNQTVPFKVFSKNCASFKGAVQIFFNPKDFTISNKPNLLIIGSPIGSFLRLLRPNKAKISSNGISFDWDNCHF